ncbi:MAG: replicative DNA helicase [Oscillochloris sp.]|nr:replicative DNA helicase [Oscillochloris sp.]
MFPAPTISRRIAPPDLGDGRTVPFDLAAERATLGALLLDRDAIIAVAPVLGPDHFYLERHAQVYEALLACYHRREPPDLTTVAAELRRQERLERVGGLTFLGDLTAEVPTAVHVEYYARAVEQAAVRRRLIEAGGQITAIGYDQRLEVDEALGQAEAAVLSVAARPAGQNFVHISRLADDLFAQISAAQEHMGEVRGLTSGLPDLDEITGGLQPSDLIIIAARPGVGKSSLAMTIALNAAVDAAAAVGVFSLEMSRDQLMQRMVAIRTGINTKRLRTGSLRAHELPQVMDALGFLSERAIFIEDTPAITITDLRNRARRLHAISGLDLVVVDYLQLVRATRAEGRVQEVGEIARGLKQLARELNVPVIALSQLSRAVEGRASHVPLLSDLRESGELEQAADMVLFIYREELYDGAAGQRGAAELHIAKHRNGPLGVVPLMFDANTTRFAPAAPAQGGARCPR